MLLFLTLDAFFRFSIEERFGGDWLISGSLGLRFSRDTETGSRPCQNMRGEFVLLLKGEELTGEESGLKVLPCLLSAAEN